MRTRGTERIEDLSWRVGRKMSRRGRDQGRGDKVLFVSEKLKPNDKSN